jgi:hypothetical protein
MQWNNDVKGIGHLSFVPLLLSEIMERIKSTPTLFPHRFKFRIGQNVHTTKDADPQHSGIGVILKREYADGLYELYTVSWNGVEDDILFLDKELVSAN